MADIIILHSSANKPEMIRLGNDLRQDGFDVVWDDTFIESGNSIPEKLEAQIQECKIILVYWTNEANQSKWVPRELDFAQNRGKMIIGLLFDDTPPNIYLSGQRHINFQNRFRIPYQELTSRLVTLIDTEPTPLASAMAWKYELKPASRIAFFAENNYLDSNNSNFTESDATRLLLPFNADDKNNGQMSWVSLAAAPLSPIHVDLNQVRNEMSSHRNSNIGVRSFNGSHEGFFSLDMMNGIKNTRESFILYKPHPDNSSSAYEYLRFDRGGAVEWANTHFYLRDHKRNKLGLLFIPLLGIFWKFVNFSSYYFNFYEYQGDVQIAVNLVNVMGTFLRAFASLQQSNFWTERLESQTNSSDSNLQYIFTMNVKSFQAEPMLTRDLVTKLSHELQRSYDLSPENRHFLPQTEEFPWGQFDLYYS
jgi:hypothetical protein